MKRNNFYIGINQRIPIEVLESSFYDLFETGSISKEHIVQQLGTEFKGKNRVGKGFSVVKRIMSHPTVSRTVKIKTVQDRKGVKSFSSFPNSDRNALYLSMIAGAYPIAFSLCNLLGSVFKVQQQCSTRLIRSKLSALYGSNRATENAIFSLIPMLIEMNLLKRDKPGLYSSAKRSIIQDRWISDIYIETYLKGLKTKTILIEDMDSHPWFYFYKPDINYIFSNNDSMLQFKESRIGGGYISIISKTSRGRI